MTRRQINHAIEIAVLILHIGLLLILWPWSLFEPGKPTDEEFYTFTE